jgi:hypothetical protein
MTGNLIKISAAAPMPLMVAPAAAAFEKLRKKIASESGRDFLARLADCYRPADYRSTKTGVANRSWHKTGRAFDYDQSADYLVVVKEPIRGSVFFRTYLKCEAGRGRRLEVLDYRGYLVSGNLYDFTAEAERLGWQRISAWRGWQRHYNYREFWHYQFTEDLTFDEALRGVRNEAKSGQKPLLRVGSKGKDVRVLQEALNRAGLLRINEIDGRFGPITRQAVIAFQRQSKLEPDGIVGSKTSALLYELYGRTN